MSLVPMQSMESLESGMSSSNSEESLQAFGHAGGVSRESFVLRRPVREGDVLVGDVLMPI